MQRSVNVSNDTKREAAPMTFMSVMKRSKKGGLQSMLKPALGSMSAQRPTKFQGSALSKTLDINSLIDSSISN